MTRATQPTSSVLAAVLGVALIAAPGPVFAQVTVDLHALDAPSTGNGTTEQPARKPPPRRQTRRPVAHAPARTEHKEAAKAEPAAPKHEPVTAAPAAPATPSAPAAAAPAAAKPAAAPPPPAATLPSAPPPEVSLTPNAPPIPAPPVPAPVPSVAALPSSTTTATAGGLRVKFPPGESAVGSDSAAALKQLAAAARAKSASASFNVVAYAPGDPSDPSTSRRLSLSRALAVRASLIAAGVDGANIYVRALGEPPASAPGGADRADVTVLGANSAGPAAATRPPPTPPPAASAPPAASPPPATAEPPLTPSRPPTSPLPGAVR
jgi:outer membrane protein OmpA-like peptidoglycan-associated protein